MILKKIGGPSNDRAPTEQIANEGGWDRDRVVMGTAVVKTTNKIGTLAGSKGLTDVVYYMKLALSSYPCYTSVRSKDQMAFFNNVVSEKASEL